jgi:chromate reductase
MSQPLLFLALSGSLRHMSYNTALLRNAAGLLPPNVRMEVGEVRDLPLYDEDVRQRGFPAPVQRLRDRRGPQK